MVGVIRQAHDGVRADVLYLPNDDVLRLRRPPVSSPCWCVFLFFLCFRIRFAFPFILCIFSSLCFYLHSQLVLTVGRRDTAVHSQLRKTKAFETPRYVRIDSELLLFRGRVLRTNIFSHFPSNSSIPCCKLYNVSQYIW